jgi:hypothetical protein
MNALKRKVDDGTHETQVSIAKMKTDFQSQIADMQKKTEIGNAAIKAEMQALKQETQALKHELQGQLAEMMQILRSRPSV